MTQAASNYKYGGEAMYSKLARSVKKDMKNCAICGRRIWLWQRADWWHCVLPPPRGAVFQGFAHLKCIDNFPYPQELGKRVPTPQKV